ncbi:MAG: hypothetical protein ACRC62_14020, partial [Microcoleus sp.]
MARPQGTCTIAAANRILSGLAIVERIELDGGVEFYQAIVRDGGKLQHKNNTELVGIVIDYAIKHAIDR